MQIDGKRRTYHRGMLRDDLSSRFDYLFEPLEADESDGEGHDARLQTLAEPDDDNRWSRRIVLTGVVLATLAATAATAVMLLQPARPAQQIVVPADATPMSTPVSPTLSQPVPKTTSAPVPALPAPVSPSADRTSTAAPTVQPQPPPVQPPSTVADEPPSTMPPSSTTRAPISVSPETPAPFPNETPPRKNKQGGGLLGG